MQTGQNHSDEKVGPFNYLALGDSYTIGEGVIERESYPHQLVAELHNCSLEFLLPTVIAKTGWTTKELLLGIEEARMRGRKFDLVTLMIGVNNQYRGESIQKFQLEFSRLVELSIQMASGNPACVILISIPDWGVTPFAANGSRTAEKIAEEVDRFNQVIQSIGKERKVHYLGITQEYRQIGGLSGSLVADHLHPSGKIYKGWAKSLKDLIFSGMNFGGFPSVNVPHLAKPPKPTGTDDTKKI